MESKMKKMKSLRFTVALAVLFTGLAHAERIADDAAWTGTIGNATSGGGTANAVINGGSGMTVTATATANNFIGIGNPTTLGSSLGAAEAGINPAWYTPDMTPTASRFGFNLMMSGSTTFTGAAIDSACAHAANSAIGSTVTCHSGSTFTITFEHPVTNPVLDVSRLGGNFFNGSGNGFFNVYASYRITTPGASLSLIDGNGQLAVTGGNTITHTAIPNGSTLGTSLSATCSELVAVSTGCGSVQVNGTFATLTFSGTINVQRASGTAALDTSATGNGMRDASHWMITVPEDYGDAPASYDPTADASHILSDLRLGPAATADNASIINTGTAASPYVGAAMPNPTAAGDANDDGASVPANVSSVAGVTTTIPVVLSGASKAGTVCGWIDFDRSGTFTSSEGVCQSFAAGATSASLVFTTPAGSTAGATVVRIRATYDTMTTATFTGLLDSGEVEDYVTTLTPPGSITIVKDAAPNDAQDFAFTTTGTGLSNFSLDDDADATLLNTRTFNGLAPGSYTVTEGAVASWALTNLICADPDSGSTVNLGTRVATIDLDAGENIACTYTNTKAATLQLRKSWVGAIIDNAVNIPATSGFANNTAALASVANTATEIDNGTAVNVFPGNVGTLPAEAFTTGTAGNYTAALACTGGGTLSGTNALTSNTLTINAADAGAVVVCTYTNTRKTASIILRKTWVNAIVNDAVNVTATDLATLASTANTANETDAGVAQTVRAGDVLTLAETFTSGSAANYDSALACTGTGGLAGNTLTVGSADTAIVCTQTNTRKTADLVITKASTPNGPFTAGQTISYSVTATNNGPSAADGATVYDPIVAGLNCTAIASCTSTGGAVCPGSLTLGGLQTSPGLAIPTFPNGGSVTFVLSCQVTATGQ